MRQAQITCFDGLNLPDECLVVLGETDGTAG
jgi:hypothetical protein